MAQGFDFRINGKNVLILSGRLIRTMDTAADGFAVSIPTPKIATNPELYQAISPYQYTPVEVYLDSTLQLTGALTKPANSKSNSGAISTLEGFSKTFNFIDSNIDSRYEFRFVNVHQMATELAKQTATQVVFDTDPGGNFGQKTARRGQSAFQFLAPIVRQRSQVMSCTPEGALLFSTTNTNSEPVGTIEEDNPNSLLQKEFNVSFDGRKRFKSYKVLSSSPFGYGQATSIDDNINQPRHRIIESNDIVGSVQETADFQKNISILDGLTLAIPIVGWEAPNGTLWEPNTLITIKSETMFIPDGFTFLIRQVEFIWEKTNKTATLSIIPPNVYTKNAVVEPWFS